MSVSRIQPASVMAGGASLAGTCLTQTTIFILASRPRHLGNQAVILSEAKNLSRSAPRTEGFFASLRMTKREAQKTRRLCRARGSAASPALEQQGGVGPAKAERI